MTLLPFSTFNLVPNGSAEELAQLCQGPGGLFSSKFVVLFKQRFAPQKDLEISGDAQKSWTLEPDLQSSWGYTMFHAVSKMGATLSACFGGGVWKIWSVADRTDDFKETLPAGECHSITRNMCWTQRTHTTSEFQSHQIWPLAVYVWLSHVTKHVTLPTRILLVVLASRKKRGSGSLGFCQKNQVRLRWISVQSEDLHCALKWELQRIGVALALIWA